MLNALLAAATIACAPIHMDEPPRLDAPWPLTDHTPMNSERMESALARYVHADDGAYSWKLVKETQLDGVKVYEIRLTSQRWRDESELSHPVWTHWLTIGVPETIRHTTPILIIGGGRRRDEPADRMRGEFTVLVKGAGTIVCGLDNVPNQPMRFAGDQNDRTEDDLLSQSWNLAMEQDDALWIGRFPMVKAAKRAMDATEEFLSTRELPTKLNGQALTNGLKPDGFFVTGASKRGWTTWLIGAVDTRVKAIAPIVIDILNMNAQTPHHFRSYGLWSEALDDYIKNGIAAKFGSPELNRVIAHEDPANYVEDVAGIPKYIITGTGDEFFPTDSFRHYENLLQGEWSLRSVPNAGHNLRGSNVLLEILAFYKAFVTNQERPHVSWEVIEETDRASVRVTITKAPVRAVTWTCDNPKGRDFRFNITGSNWMQKELLPTEEGGTTFVFPLSKPAEGFRATMAEFTFAPPDPGTPPMVMTTRVFITPDVLPFELKAATAPKP